jgi:hypothetical protein
MLNTTLSLGCPVTSDYNVTEIQLLINAIKGLVLDGTFTTATQTYQCRCMSTISRPAFYPVDFSPFFPPSPPPPIGADAIRVAGYKYKTGRDGNLTLLFPTQEAMANYLGVDAQRRKELHPNRLLVPQQQHRLQRRLQPNKERLQRRKVAIADVTFVLAISARQRQTSQRPLRQNMVVQRNRRHNNGLPRPHHSRPRPQDMDIHSRTRNPRSSQMDRRQNNTTMATNIREIHQIRLRPSLRQATSTDGYTTK